ncbi:MAG: TlpA family protein disulfide reductase [Fimbriimonadales bacterium]
MLVALVFAVCAQKPDYSVILKANEDYAKATSVSGTIECQAFGSKEIWAFSIAPKSFAVLQTPNRVYSSEMGHYIVYHPFNKTYTSQELPKNTLVQLPEIWLFADVGRGGNQPAPFLRTQEAPKKIEMYGRSVWALGGLSLPNGGKAECYVDATTGALLGWKESWTGPGRTRRYRITSLHWNTLGPKGKTPFVLPGNAKKIPGDSPLFLPPGQRLPDVNLVDEKGRKTTLAQLLKGTRGAVVSIGSPGCGPCELSKRFASKNIAAFRAKNIPFVALESWGCTDSDLQKIVHDNPVAFPTYRPSGPDDLQDRLKLAGAPTIYLLDSQGRVIDAQQGFEAKAFVKILRVLGLTNLKA